MSLRQYWKASRFISDHGGASALLSLFRLLCFKAATGYGPDLYLLYRLQDKPFSLSAWKQYVDKKTFCQMLFTVNKKHCFAVLEDKVLFAQRCKEKRTPHPQVFFTVNYRGSATAFPNYNTAQAQQGFASLPPGDYIVKICDGSYGEGLWLISITEQGVYRHNDKSVCSVIEFAQTIAHTGAPYLVQQCVANADSLNDIMPGRATGTLRVVTFYHKDKKTEAPYRFFKLPRKTVISDNYGGGFTGNLLAMLDSDNAVWRALIGTEEGYPLLTDHHPDTNTPLIAYTNLGIADAVTASIKCAEAFPEIPAVGWDVILSEAGPLILEGNPMFDPTGPQLCADSGVRDYMTAKLKELAVV